MSVLGTLAPSELVTETGWRACSTGCGASLQMWVEEMAPYLKAIDPNHLVTLGAEGFYSTTCERCAALPHGTGHSVIRGSVWGSWLCWALNAFLLHCGLAPHIGLQGALDLHTGAWRWTSIPVLHHLQALCSMAWAYPVSALG